MTELKTQYASAQTASSNNPVLPNLPPVPANPIQEKEEKSTATGMNKLTVSIVKGLKKASKAIDDVYYGKPDAARKVKVGMIKLGNPLDFGLKPLIDLLASIDLCNIINSALNASPKSKPIDPKNKPQQNSPFGKIKYDIQNFAYIIQKIIDKYYSKHGSVDSLSSKIALENVITEISQNISLLLDSELLTDPLITSAFPQIKIFENYFDNALGFYNRYSNVRSLPFNEVQKIIKIINKTKTTCAAIQALDSPASLISLADSFMDDKIAKQIQKLNKLIDPKKIQSVIKSIINTCKKLQNIINTVLRVITLLQQVLKIITIIAFVIKNIRWFLKALPIPNVFTVAGITTTLSSAEGELKSTGDKFLDRVVEINTIFQSIINILKSLTIKLLGIISGCRLIILNLQNCGESPTDDLINEFTEVVDNLQATNDKLIEIVKKYEDGKQNKQRRFGDFNIKILTEQLVDEGISLKRRYGIALDKYEIIAVQSTPTFASDDNIIIDEVKLLLISKKLVGKKLSFLSPTELSIYEEAFNILGDGSEIPIDLPSSDQESPDNEDDESEDGLGLNAFMNKLKGGKRLRKRMKKMLANHKRTLADNISKSNPNSKIAKKTEQAALQDEIDVLKIKIKDWKDKIAAIILPPSLINAILITKLKKDISKAEDEIKKKEQQIKSLQLPNYKNR